MTVLDVLRYPVTDIYNMDQINALPAELFAKWVSQELPEAIFTDILRADKDGQNRWGYIHSMIFGITRRFSKSRGGRNAMLELAEIELTASLKKAIADYEPL